MAYNKDCPMPGEVQYLPARCVPGRTGAQIVRVDPVLTPFLDLHGYSIHDGWEEFTRFIKECNQSRKRFAIVMTGQGKMKEEFPDWVAANPHLRNYKLQDGNGSFKVKFKPRFGVRK